MGSPCANKNRLWKYLLTPNSKRQSFHSSLDQFLDWLTPMPGLEETSSTAELRPVEQRAKSNSLQAVVTCSQDSSPATDSSRSNSSSHSGEKHRGWYGCKKTYRSVAYGTWKVGGARKLLSSSSSDFSIRDPQSLPLNEQNGCMSDSEHCTDDHNMIMNGSYSSTTTNITHCHKANSCHSRRDSDLSTNRCVSRQDSAVSVWNNSDIETTSTDCYSSQDYYNFKSLNNIRFSQQRSSSTDDEGELSAPESGSELDQSLQTVLDSFRELRNYVSLRRPNNKKRHGKKKPPVFGHQRSQSAGCGTIFAIKSPMKENQESNNGSNAVTATKNFLKKLYQTSAATMPRLSSTSSRSTASSKSNKESFKSTTAESSQLTPPMNGLVSPSITSPKINGIEPKKQMHFASWEEACEHLKIELQSIRQRDMMILRNFQQLEQRLQCIKQPQDGPSPIVELPPNLEFAFSTVNRVYVPKQSSYDVDL